MRLLTLAAALLAAGTALLAAPTGHAEERVWRHGSSLMGEPKYPKDFPHFAYVNPQAPKGGTLRMAATGTFDSFNPVIIKGNPVYGLGQVYETLMTSALDEASTEYGEIAEALTWPADFSSVTYRLNPKARWHDGKPITPDDVIWSFQAQKENNPRVSAYYRHVVKAEKSGEREVTFTFDAPGNRELPQIVGQLMVLPKHWWEGTGPDGKKRSITETTLEPPLGSGPYRVKRFETGRSITYERVKDWWGANEPANIGMNNFDEIRYEYFRDDSVSLEAFKGDVYDLRIESSAKNWATAYDVPPRADGRMALEILPSRGLGIMQAFVPNLRRAKFADPKVRLALSYAFDFEGTNRALFFGQYKRIASFFQPTELASSGVPQGRELEILKEAEKAGPVPREAFEKPFSNPTAPDQNAARTNLREALRLFAEAGWVAKNGKLVSQKTGEPFTVEYLIDSPAFERVAVRWAEDLAKIGVTMTIRNVDSAQYENRVRQFDFDLVTDVWAQSLSPGNEQLYYWGSAAADQDGSRNTPGIRDKAVDFVISKIIYAHDRDELVAATHALDRILLWNHYVIPAWGMDGNRVARWNRFGHPDLTLTLSPASAIPTLWWWDAAAAAKTGVQK